jgi:hypothetical protein
MSAISLKVLILNTDIKRLKMSVNVYHLGVQPSGLAWLCMQLFPCFFISYEKSALHLHVFYLQKFFQKHVNHENV